MSGCDLTTANGPSYVECGACAVLSGVGKDKRFDVGRVFLDVGSLV
jgi:hypothetical protein